MSASKYDERAYPPGTIEPSAIRELLREARDTVEAATAEKDISDDRREYRKRLVVRINRALAQLGTTH